MRRSKSSSRPRRGEIWWIRFDPAKGSETRKTRPAVVINLPAVGGLPLRIMVPVTDWKSSYATVPSLVYLKSTRRNGLKKESAADCFQVKSVSLMRFVSKLGELRADEIEEISAAIGEVDLCPGDVDLCPGDQAFRRDRGLLTFSVLHTQSPYNSTKAASNA